MDRHIIHKGSFINIKNFNTGKEIYAIYLGDDFTTYLTSHYPKELLIWQPWIKDQIIPYKTENIILIKKIEKAIRNQWDNPYYIEAIKWIKKNNPHKFLTHENQTFRLYGKYFQILPFMEV